MFVPDIPLGVINVTRLVVAYYIGPHPAAWPAHSINEKQILDF